MASTVSNGNDRLRKGNRLRRRRPCVNSLKLFFGTGGGGGVREGVAGNGEEKEVSGP